MIIFLSVILILVIFNIAISIAIAGYIVNFKNEENQFKEVQIDFMDKAKKRMPRLYGEDEI